MTNRDFDMVAHLDIPEGGAQGVVICPGGNMAGWSLYVKDNRPVYPYNWLGHDQYSIASDVPLPRGPVALRPIHD